MKHGEITIANLWAENKTIILDLTAAPFFNTPQPRLKECAQREIEAICRVLIQHLQGVTVLLTGSFSAGEGKGSDSEEPPIIRSDYDIVVVTPRLLDSFPFWVRKKLQADMSRIRLSADLDISLVWKPFLVFGITTTAGLIIAGKKGLEPSLAALGPPSAFKADLIAYRFLAQAPLDVPRYSMLVSKAIVRSAQAFLLDRFSNRPRSEWVGLSSVRFIHETIERYANVIGWEDIRSVQKACHALLDMKSDVWTHEMYKETYELLNRLCSNRVPPSRWQDFMKHAFWLKHHQLSGFPSIRSERHALESLKCLCNAWGPKYKLDVGKLAEANQNIGKLCRNSVNNVERDPVGSYERLMMLLTRYIDFYPHKLRYSRH